MWLDTPSANELRDSMPDVALALETDFLCNSLDRLGVQYIRRSRKKSAVIEIAMQPGYLLRIHPVDKGAQGVGEWMTWYWKQPDDENVTASLHSSIRAFVEFVDLNNEDDDAQSVSFTTHSDDMRDLIQDAIGGMRHITGKRLKPVVVQRRWAA